MADLVTLEEARNHLLLDTTATDSWLSIFIPAISQAVLLWLKDDWRAYELVTDSSGDPIYDSAGDGYPMEDSNGPIVKPVVKAACLVELALQFRYRDGAESESARMPSHAGYGYVLGVGATSLLTPLRKPTVQ